MSDSSTTPPVETFRGYDPRLRLFYPVLALMLVTLAGGLAWQQLGRRGVLDERERVQNQRRIVVPGPRGNIYDREGRLLVGNRARFAAVLYLDELRPEFRHRFLTARAAYFELDDAGLPNDRQLSTIARASVVQGYLDEVNRLLGRDYRVEIAALERHFRQELLLPFTLVDDLAQEDYARLIESLPVTSPLQVHTSSTRFYPYHAAAAHALGFVSQQDGSAAEGMPGEDLKTFAFKGWTGRDGLERAYDAQLQGQAGGVIFRVDPGGFRVDPPLERHLPVQGSNLVSSLDIDLQLAAEESMENEVMLNGSAVVLDVATGEVLVFANRPGYDLNDFSPRLSQARSKEINEAGAWNSRALAGVYPPGSTFKLITALAGLRAGTINAQSRSECTGYFKVGARLMVCRNHSDRGVIDLPTALQKSCNVFFYEHGLSTGIEGIAAEARRFHLHEPTGVDLPHESRRMLIGDPAWKREHEDTAWFPGDTANTSIGQGFVGVTPLQMACFAASLARGETQTRPFLLHDPARPRQQTPPIDLPADKLALIREGMLRVVREGTGRRAQPAGVTTPFAGKTGTAQVRTTKGTIELAWFVGYAPADKPEIAWAIVMEGDQPDEATGGGMYAAPVAKAFLTKFFEKKNRPKPLQLFSPPVAAADGR